MRDTLKAVNGYKVIKLVFAEGLKDLIPSYYEELVDKGLLKLIKDGDDNLSIVELTSTDDYLGNKDGNECFYQVGIFTTVKGNQFIWWGDIETGDEYITKLEKN